VAIAPFLIRNYLNFGHLYFIPLDYQSETRSRLEADRPKSEDLYRIHDKNYGGFTAEFLQGSLSYALSRNRLMKVSLSNSWSENLAHLAAFGRELTERTQGAVHTVLAAPWVTFDFLFLTFDSHFYWVANFYGLGLLAVGIFVCLKPPFSQPITLLLVAYVLLRLGAHVLTFFESRHVPPLSVAFQIIAVVGLNGLLELLRRTGSRQAAPVRAS